MESELAELLDQRSTHRQQREQLSQQYQQLAQNAPAWHTAQSALERLQEQCGKTLESP